MLVTAVMVYPVQITSAVTVLTRWLAALMETVILSALTINAQPEELSALEVLLYVTLVPELVENAVQDNVQTLILTVVPLVELIYLTSTMELHALQHKSVKMQFVQPSHHQQLQHQLVQENKWF